MGTEALIVNLLLLSRTCSWTQTCLVPNDQHVQESLTPRVQRGIPQLGGVLSSDVADMLMDTDADTDTDTVIWVETVEWCLRIKELSSPHPALSGSCRVHMHQS